MLYYTYMELFIQGLALVLKIDVREGLESAEGGNNKDLQDNSFRVFGYSHTNTLPSSGLG